MKTQHPQHVHHRRSAWIVAGILATLTLLAATSAAKRDPTTPESARDPQVMTPESARDEQKMVPETATDNPSPKKR